MKKIYCDFCGADTSTVSFSIELRVANLSKVADSCSKCHSLFQDALLSDHIFHLKQILSHTNKQQYLKPSTHY